MGSEWEAQRPEALRTRLPRAAGRRSFWKARSEAQKRADSSQRCGCRGRMSDKSAGQRFSPHISHALPSRLVLKVGGMVWAGVCGVGGVVEGQGRLWVGCLAVGGVFWTWLRRENG